MIPTTKNKVIGAIADALPDSLAAKVHRGLSEPGSANKRGGAGPIVAGTAALGVGLALFAALHSRR